MDGVCTVMKTYKRKFETERDLYTQIQIKMTKREEELLLLNKQYTQTKNEHIKTSQKYKALEKEMAEKLTNYNEMKNTLKTSEEIGKLKDNELETLKINLEKCTKQLANLKVVCKILKIVYKSRYNFYF